MIDSFIVRMGTYIYKVDAQIIVLVVMKNTNSDADQAAYIPVYIKVLFIDRKVILYYTQGNDRYIHFHRFFFYTGFSTPADFTFPLNLWNHVKC